MWSVFLTLKVAVSYILYGSVKVGQFIVTTLHSLLTSYLAFQNKLLMLLTVIIEDFSIFLRDVIYHINNIVANVAYICERTCTCAIGVYTSVVDLLQGSYNMLSVISNFGIRTLVSFINGVKNIFLLLKQIILMFGDGVWFIVVYIPKSVIFLCLESVVYTRKCLIEMYSHMCAHIRKMCTIVFESIYDCYYFLTDVPVESTIGIVIAVCFVYIFLQFYAILYIYVKNKLLTFFHGLKRIYRRVKNTMFRMSSRTSQQTVFRTPVHYTAPTSTSPKKSEDSACIICQDKPKCILVLPCKHLCLCMDCTPRLMRYTGHCPICRRRISSTMKIFT